MKKQAAIAALGGTGHGARARAAERLGVTRAAIGNWPDPLPDRIAQRVLGVLALPYLPAHMLRELGLRRR